MVLGALALFVSLGALSLALWIILRPTNSPDDVLRAFKRLEDEFEALQDKVNSHLGRISRLKREVLPPTPTKPGDSQPLTRGQLLARSRRTHGNVAYDEGDSSE